MIWFWCLTPISYSTSTFSLQVFSFLRRSGFSVVSVCFPLESFQQATRNFSFAIALSLCLHWSPSKVSFVGSSGLQTQFGACREVHRYHFSFLALSRIVFCSQVTECSQRCPDFIVKLLRISFWVMWVTPTSASLEQWPLCCSAPRFVAPNSTKIQQHPIKKDNRQRY